MEYQNVEVVIDKEGNVVIEVDGVTGKACDAITKQLEKVLGKVESKEYKPEYYDEEKDEENKLSSNT
ncbi:MAG: DUF2997 domain-containing protein [Candidatus Delongbacteria bacterium]|jgi:hypothetical protein|nr:DUF2997 domain-containing protein [Candidatus Delongbacteria bacterium]